MKLISLNVGNDILEVHNNMWTGVETVTFNGYEVSRQFNWFRVDHDFSVSSEDGNGTDYFRVVILMNSMAGITVDVYRNEETLLAQSNEAKRRSRPNRIRSRRAEHLANPEALYHEEDLV